MKKLIRVFIAIIILGFLYSCSAEEVVIEQEQLDCECDRVVEINTFNIVGTPENPATVHHSIMITINDCTEIQKQKTHNTTNINLIPKLGECR